MLLANSSSSAAGCAGGGELEAVLAAGLGGAVAAAALLALIACLARSLASISANASSDARVLSCSVWYAVSGSLGVEGKSVAGGMGGGEAGLMLTLAVMPVLSSCAVGSMTISLSSLHFRRRHSLMRRSLLSSSLSRAAGRLGGGSGRGSSPNGRTGCSVSRRVEWGRV